MSEKINCYEGEIIDWNWTRDYGIARIISDGPNKDNEVFVHYSNVKIQAKDEDGNPLVINGKPWYGREAAENFSFDGREVKDMRKNQIWFDLYETIWFVLDNTKPNIALAITWSKEDSIEKYQELE